MRLRRLLRSDDGALSLFAVMIVPALLLMIGLVVDGGRRFADGQQAQAYADELARAAAQGVDPASYLQGQIVLNGDLVQSDAAHYLNAIRAAGATGVQGSVQLTGADTVTATVVVTVPTQFLGSLGVLSPTVTGQATVVLDHGVLKPGG